MPYCFRLLLQPSNLGGSLRLLAYVVCTSPAFADAYSKVCVYIYTNVLDSLTSAANLIRLDCFGIGPPEAFVVRPAYAVQALCCRFQP